NLLCKQWLIPVQIESPMYPWHVWQHLNHRYREFLSRDSAVLFYTYSNSDVLSLYLLRLGLFWVLHLLIPKDLYDNSFLQKTLNYPVQVSLVSSIVLQQRHLLAQAHWQSLVKFVANK